MSRRKRILIVLIFAVAIAGPVFFVVMRGRRATVAPPIAPQPAPAAPEPVAETPPPAPVQPQPAPVVEAPPPQPDPAAIDAERRAALRANARAAFDRGFALQRVGDLPGAVLEYQQAVALDPDMAGGWTNLGLALAALNRSAEGLDAARRALATPIMSDAKRRAHAWCVVGHIAKPAQDPTVAMDAFTQALAADPACVPAAIGLAELQGAHGQVPAAIATLTAARDAGAQSVAIHTNLAVFSLETRDAAGSTEHARAALRMNPDQHEAKLVLGYAQLLLERWADAAQNLDEAARGDAGNADLQVALGYAYEKLGRRDDALAAFDRALTLRSTHESALQNRAITLERMGEGAAAQQAYQRTIAARGPNAGGARDGGATGTDAPAPGAAASAQLQLAVMAAQRKDWPEARRLVEPLVAADPKNAQARFVLGLACFFTGDRACAAMQEYELTPLDAARAATLRTLISQH